MQLPDPKHCGRKTRGDYPCKNWVLPGQTVCRMHGGSSPQALKKAEERMRDLVHPAISALERQITKDEFPATKYVLDWAGFKPADQTTPTDNAVSVTVVFDHADQNTTTLALPD
jgi:hypothetical protein